MEDLVENFAKNIITSESNGVSFRGKGMKLDKKADCEVVVNAINSCKNMTFLDLEGNTLGVDAAESLADALKTKKELKRALWKDLFTGRMKTEIPLALAFLGNGLSVAGARLKELDMSDNAFGPIGVEAMVKLVESPVCYQLEELRLNNNGLGITGAELLAKALLNCYSNSLAAGQPFALKVFIAGRNRLEDKGATALAKVFETLGSLEEISIPQNGIYYKGITKLSAALSNNPNLRILNLNDNSLTPKGALALSRVIPQLQNLQILNLGDCLLKNEGAVHIAGSLASSHPDLEEVFFEANEIKSEGSLALIRALRNKLKLKRLNISDNSFGRNTRDRLLQELTWNPDVLECMSDTDNEDSEDDEECASGNDDDEDCASEDDDQESNDEKGDEIHSDDVAVDSVIDEIAGLTVIGNSPVDIFMRTPSVENFSSIQHLDKNQIFESFKMNTNDLNVEEYVELIMKVSNLSLNRDENIRRKSSIMAVALYKALFEWTNSISLPKINNCLFVYLSLIKDEDNKVKINWDVDQCVKILQAAIVEKIVPHFTQQTLTFCLERKFKQKTVEHVTVI